MARKTTRNNELLKSAKVSANPKIYDLLLDLVNDDREDLAEDVLKIDYLLKYVSTCIRQRDYIEARNTLEKVKARIDMLKKEEVNTEYIEYLYEGISKKAKVKQ